MSSHCNICSWISCLVLLSSMFSVVQSRRGGGFGRGGAARRGVWGGESAGRVGWGAGGGHPHHAPPAHPHHVPPAYTGGSTGHSTGNVGWGAGSGHPHHVPPAHHAQPAHTGGSSGHGTGRVVGAAAAGALGGMLIGHGLSSMAQPGYGHGGYGGYGGYGHGYGHGHPRHGAHGSGHLEDHDHEFHNETDVDYYTGAASPGPIYSCVMVCGAVMSFLLGHFLS